MSTDTLSFPVTFSNFFEFLLNNGDLHNNYLKFNINLRELLRKEIRQHHYSILTSIINCHIDIFQIDPAILDFCISHNFSGVIDFLISHDIDVAQHDADIVRKLARAGFLHSLQQVLHIHDFNNFSDVIIHICQTAILHRQIEIIQHFLSHNSALDLHALILYCIEYTDYPDVIQEFLNLPLDWSYQNYLVIRNAQRFNRHHTLKLLATINSDIHDIIYPTVNIISKPASNTFCEITHDIVDNHSQYRQCINQHVFLNSSWDLWRQYKSCNDCPICLHHMDNNIYINIINDHQ